MVRLTCKDITLYFTPLSPCCRAVLLCLKEIGLNVKLRHMDLHSKSEQLEPWFVKMNPQHIVPTLEDRGYILWESRAINTYLVNKFGNVKRERLMPLDPTMRATVERLLHFDLGTFYASIVAFFGPQMMQQQPADPVKGAALERSLNLLDIELRDKDYVAGGTGVSLADLSLLASLSGLEAYQYSYNHHPNVSIWARRLKQQLPYYDSTMEEGVELARKWAVSRLTRGTKDGCL